MQGPCRAIKLLFAEATGKPPLVTSRLRYLVLDHQTRGLPGLLFKLQIDAEVNRNACGLFLYFHFYMERFWRAIIRLPLYHHGDDRSIDDDCNLDFQFRFADKLKSAINDCL